MRRRTLLITLAALGVASTAAAQMGGMGGGGGSMGGGRGRGNHGGQKPSDSSSSSAKPPTSPNTPEKPVSEIDMFGVISAVDPKTQRLTIAYEANDALNLPKGEQPFEVAKTDLMTGAAVGERVRFRIDSHQISYLTPWKPPTPDAP